MTSLQHFKFLDIKSKELASTKKQAAQKVALSLVRQLFHLGAIEGAEPGQLQAKKLKSDEVCRGILRCLGLCGNFPLNFKGV
jgi:hypothetical protein